MIIANTFCKYKQVYKTIKEVVSRGEIAIVDYTIVPRPFKREIKDVRIKRRYEIGSDHFLLDNILKYKKSK